MTVDETPSERPDATEQIVGNEGIAVDQDPTTGQLLAQLIGNEGLAIDQDPTNGQLLAQLIGDEGLAVAQDANGRLEAVILGDAGVVNQDADGNLNAVILGGDGDPVTQDADNNLVITIQGDSGTISQDGSGRLLAAMIGSQGNVIDQDASDRLVTAIVGDQGSPVAQDASDRLVTAIVGDQGSPVAQDANNRLVTAIVGDQGSPVAQDANNRLESVILGGNDNPVSQNADNELVTRVVANEGLEIIQDPSSGELQQQTTVLQAEDINSSLVVDSTTVSASSIDSIFVTPPSGTVWEVLGVQAGAPSISGSTGTHEIKIFPENSSLELTQGEANGTSLLDYDFGRWESADDTQKPTGDEAQLSVIRGVRVDETSGLEFQYGNFTDKDQTGQREAAVWAREISVA